MWCLDEYLLLCGRWTERLHRRPLQPTYQISRGSPHTPEARLHPLDVLLAPAQTRHAETLPRKGALPERNVPRCPERRRATARMPSPSRPPQGMLPDAARWLCWQSMRVEPRIALMLLAACSGGAEDRLLGWHLCAQHRHRLREHALARARRPDGLGRARRLGRLAGAEVARLLPLASCGSSRHPTRNKSVPCSSCVQLILREARPWEAGRVSRDAAPDWGVCAQGDRLGWAAW